MDNTNIGVNNLIRVWGINMKDLNKNLSLAFIVFALAGWQLLSVNFTFHDVKKPNYIELTGVCS